MAILTNNGPDHTVDPISPEPQGVADTISLDKAEISRPTLDASQQLEQRNEQIENSVIFDPTKGMTAPITIKPAASTTTDHHQLAAQQQNSEAMFLATGKRKRGAREDIRFQLAALGRIPESVKRDLESNIEALLQRAAENSPSGIQASPEALKNVVEEVIKEARGTLTSLVTSTTSTDRDDVAAVITDELEKHTIAKAESIFGKDHPAVETLRGMFQQSRSDGLQLETRSLVAASHSPADQELDAILSGQRGDALTAIAEFRKRHSADELRAYAERYDQSHARPFLSSVAGNYLETAAARQEVIEKMVALGIPREHIRRSIDFEIRECQDRTTKLKEQQTAIHGEITILERSLIERRRTCLGRAHTAIEHLNTIRRGRGESALAAPNIDPTDRDFEEKLTRHLAPCDAEAQALRSTSHRHLPGSAEARFLESWKELETIRIETRRIADEIAAKHQRIAEIETSITKAWEKLTEVYKSYLKEFGYLGATPFLVTDPARHPVQPPPLNLQGGAGSAAARVAFELPEIVKTVAKEASDIGSTARQQKEEHDEKAQDEWKSASQQASGLLLQKNFDAAEQVLLAYRSEYPDAPDNAQVTALLALIHQKRAEDQVQHLREIAAHKHGEPIAALATLRAKIGAESFEQKLNLYETTTGRPFISDLVARYPDQPAQRIATLRDAERIGVSKHHIQRFVECEVRSHALVRAQAEHEASNIGLAKERLEVARGDLRAAGLDRARALQSSFSEKLRQVVPPPELDVKDPEFDAKLASYLEQFDSIKDRIKDLQVESDTVEREAYLAWTAAQQASDRCLRASREIQDAQARRAALEEEIQRSTRSCATSYGPLLQEYGYLNKVPESSLRNAHSVTAFTASQKPGTALEVTPSFTTALKDARTEIARLHSVAQSDSPAGTKAKEEIAALSWRGTETEVRALVSQGKYEEASSALVEYRKRFPEAEGARASATILDTVQRFAAYEGSGVRALKESERIKGSIKANLREDREAHVESRDELANKADAAEPWGISRVWGGYSSAKQDAQMFRAESRNHANAIETTDKICSFIEVDDDRRNSFSSQARAAALLTLEGRDSEASMALRGAETQLSEERNNTRKVQELLTEAKRNTVLAGTSRTMAEGLSTLETKADPPYSETELTGISQAAGEETQRAHYATISVAINHEIASNNHVKELDARIAEAATQQTDAAIKEYFERRHPEALHDFEALQRDGKSGDTLLTASFALVPGSERSLLSAHVTAYGSTAALERWVQEGPGDRGARAALRNAIVNGAPLSGATDPALTQELILYMRGAREVDAATKFFEGRPAAEKTAILAEYRRVHGISLAERLCGSAPAITAQDLRDPNSHCVGTRAAFFSHLARSGVMDHKDAKRLFPGLMDPASKNPSQGIRDLVSRDIETMRHALFNDGLGATIERQAHDRAVFRALENTGGLSAQAKEQRAAIIGSQRTDLDALSQRLDGSSSGFSTRTQLRGTLETITSNLEEQMSAAVTAPGSANDAAARSVAKLLVECQQLKTRGKIAEAEVKVLEAADTVRALKMQKHDEALIGRMVSQRIAEITPDQKDQPPGFKTSDLRHMLRAGSQTVDGRDTETTSLALEALSSPARYDERRIRSLIAQNNQQQLLTTLVRQDPRDPETLAAVRRAAGLRATDPIENAVPATESWGLARQYLAAVERSQRAAEAGNEAELKDALTTIEAFRLNRELTIHKTLSGEQTFETILRLDRELGEQGLDTFSKRYNEIFGASSLGNTSIASSALGSDLRIRFGSDPAATPLIDAIQALDHKAIGIEAARYAVAPNDRAIYDKGDDKGAGREISYALFNDAVAKLSPEERSSLAARLDEAVRQGSSQSADAVKLNSLADLLAHRTPLAAEQDQAFVKAVLQHGSLDRERLDAFTSLRSDLIEQRTLCNTWHAEATSRFAEAEKLQKEKLSEYREAKAEYEQTTYNPIRLYAGGKEAERQRAFTYQAFTSLQQIHLDKMDRDGVQRIERDRSVVDTMGRFATHEILLGDRHKGEMFAQVSSSTVSHLEQRLSQVNWSAVDTKAATYFQRELSESTALLAKYNGRVAMIEATGETILLVGSAFTGPVGAAATAGLLASYKVGRSVYDGKALGDALWENKLNIAFAMIPFAGSLGRARVFYKISYETAAGGMLIEERARKIWYLNGQLGRWLKIDRATRAVAVADDLAIGAQRAKGIFRFRDTYTVRLIKGSATDTGKLADTAGNLSSAGRLVRGSDRLWHVSPLTIVQGGTRMADSFLAGYLRQPATPYPVNSDPDTKLISGTGKPSAPFIMPRFDPPSDGQRELRPAPPGPAGTAPGIFIIDTQSSPKIQNTTERTPNTDRSQQAQPASPPPPQTTEGTPPGTNQAGTTAQVGATAGAPDASPATVTTQGSEQIAPGTEPQSTSPTATTTATTAPTEPPAAGTPGEPSSTSTEKPGDALTAFITDDDANAYSWIPAMLSGSSPWSGIFTASARDTTSPFNPPPPSTPPYQPPPPPPPTRPAPPRDPPSGRPFGAITVDDGINTYVLQTRAEDHVRTARAHEQQRREQERTVHMHSVIPTDHLVIPAPETTAVLHTYAQNLATQHAVATNHHIQGVANSDAATHAATNTLNNALSQRDGATTVSYVNSSAELNTASSKWASVFTDAHATSEGQIDATSTWFTATPQSSSANRRPSKAREQEIGLDEEKSKTMQLVDKKTLAKDQQNEELPKIKSKEPSSATEKATKDGEIQERLAERTQISKSAHTDDTPRMKSVSLHSKEALHATQSALSGAQEAIGMRQAHPNRSAKESASVASAEPHYSAATYLKAQTEGSSNNMNVSAAGLADLPKIRTTVSAAHVSSHLTAQPEQIATQQIDDRQHPNTRSTKYVPSKEETTVIEASTVALQLARSFKDTPIPDTIQTLLQAEAEEGGGHLFASPKLSKNKIALRQKRLREILVWQLKNREFDRAKRERLLYLLAQLGMSQSEYLDLVAQLGERKAEQAALHMNENRLAITTDGEIITPESTKNVISNALQTDTPKPPPASSAKTTGSLSKADLYRRLAKKPAKT